MTTTLRVKLDGEVHNVTVHYGHWLPHWLRVGGVSIGRSIFIRRARSFPHLLLLGHELVHTLDYVRKLNSVPGRVEWMAVAWDLLAYFLSWVRVGFRYSAMPEEIKAYSEQGFVYFGHHADIQIIEEDA
jgi:hypothetical protein